MVLLRAVAMAFGLLSLAPSVRAANDFSLTNVVIEVGGTTYRAATVDVAGSPLSRDDFLALLDPKAPSSAADRLARLDAARISAPEVVLDQSAGGAAQHVVYRDVVLEDVKAGQIAHITSAGATIDMHVAQGGDIAGRVGAIRIEGVDLALLAHMLVEGRKDPNEMTRTVVASGGMDAFELDLPGENKARIGSIVFRDLGGRALAVPMTSLVDLAPKPGEMPAPPSPERQKALSALAADIFTSQTVGSLELTDFGVQMKSGATTRFAKITIAGLASGKIATIAFDGLSVALPDGGKLSFERLGLSGLDLVPVLTQAANAATDPKRVTPRFDSLDLSKLAGRLVVPGSDPLSIELAHAGIAAGGWQDFAPSSLTFGLDHLAFDLPADDARWRPLRDLGYSRLDLSLSANPALDTAKQELTLPKLALSAPGLGEIALAARFSNVDAALIGRDTEKARAALSASMFRHATLVVSDGGLLGRLIDTQTRRANGPASDVRARWANAARLAVTNMLTENPDRGAVADAVEKFVHRGGTLTIDADAPNGFGVIDLMLSGGLSGILGKLKLSARN